MADAHEDPTLEQEEEEEDITLKNPLVVEKYKFAGQFCNVAVKAVVDAIKPGVTVLELAKIGDQSLIDQTEKCFNKGKGEDKVEKGVAFPCCISVNQYVCHYAPEEDDKSAPLELNDVVRIDLGCHIDGFCAVAAHTVIVREDMAAAIAEADHPAANAIAAAHAAQEALVHLIRPGGKSEEVTACILKIAKEFNVTPVEGVLSHQLKRYIIDGSNVITNKNAPDQHVFNFEIDEATAWTLDLAFSSSAYDEKDTSGAGQLKEAEARTSIYKRSLENNYMLKMKASREVFSDITRRFQTFPFGVRHLDSKKGRFCISECLKHDLVEPYPVLKSGKDEHVAHFKSTILIKTSEIEKVTKAPAQPITTDKKITDKDVLEACSKSLTLKKKKKKNKKKGDKADE